MDKGTGRFDLQQNRWLSEFIHKRATACNTKLIKKSNLHDRSDCNLNRNRSVTEEDKGRNEEHLNNCTNLIHSAISRSTFSYKLIPPRWVRKDFGRSFLTAAIRLAISPPTMLSCPQPFSMDNGIKYLKLYSTSHRARNVSYYPQQSRSTALQNVNVSCTVCVYVCRVHSLCTYCMHVCLYVQHICMYSIYICISIYSVYLH